MGTGLPRSIMRPVYLAFIALTAFLVFVVVWGTQTSISTTVRVSGSVHSQRPPIVLQHAFGGKIESLHVSSLEQVRAGQLLLTLDVSARIALRAEILEREDHLREERTALEVLLTTGSATGVDASLPIPSVQQHLEDWFAHIANIDVLTHRETQAQAQATALSAELEILDAQIDLIARQITAEAPLVRQGVVTARAHEEVIRQKLQVQERRAARALDRNEAISTSKGAALEREAQMLNHRTALRQRQAAIVAELAGLAEKRINLDAEIEAAEIFAPYDGLISELHFESVGSVIGAGQEIAKLAPPLQLPEIRVDVPVSSIDQVYLNMTGKLTINSLPARDMPPIALRLISISPVAARDSEGTPLFYEASAIIDTDDLSAARTALGDRFRLSADMPVSATFEGQSMSPFGFLFRPITGLFDSAFEDV